MRFNPFSGSNAGRAMRLRLASLTVAMVVVAGIVVTATSVSSAKNKQRAGSVAAASQYPTKVEYGTLVKGTLPKSGKPARGGTITIGQLNGQTPTGINPIIASAQCSTQTFEFVADQYIPLYYGPNGARPAIDQGLSAALPPSYTNHDTTVIIHIKPGLKWSDGAPVNAEDLAFWYYLTKAATNASPANWCQYASSTEFPYNVRSVSYHGDVLVMHLKHPVNPTWFTLNQLQDTNGGAYPLPAQAWDVNSSGQKLTDWATNPKDALAIWNNLNTQGTSLSDFSTSPLWKVVDGPFKLQSFNTTNSSYVLTPNPSYGLKPKPTETVDVNTYTSASAQLDALESGSLDIAALDPGTQLGSIPTLRQRGFSVFGGPSFGWFGGYLNFKDATDHFNKVIAQPYIRGVFAELVNDPAIIQGVYHGWAVPAYGPIAQYPQSPYVPVNVTRPYWKFNPKKAAATLRAHGWAVHPGGQTVCAHPGKGPHNCGAGIPKGTPIKFVWANVPESVASTGVLESEAFASQAKSAAGIDVTFQTKTFNFLTSNYNDQSPSAKKFENDWGVNNYGGVFVDYYPTQEGILNTAGSLNDGFYNDPIANRLMANSVRSPSKLAIQKEIAYFVKSQPIIFFPLQDQILAVSKKVGGTTAGFLEMTQQQINPSLLWANK